MSDPTESRWVLYNRPDAKHHTREDLRELYDAGRIDGDTPVKAVGDDEFVPYSFVEPKLSRRPETRAAEPSVDAPRTGFALALARTLPYVAGVFLLIGWVAAFVVFDRGGLLAGLLALVQFGTVAVGIYIAGKTLELLVFIHAHLEELSERSRSAG